MSYEQRLIEIINDGDVDAATQFIHLGPKAKLNINAIELNRTILYSAVRLGNPVLLKQILEYPNLNIHSEGNNIAVHEAAGSNKPEILQMLIANGANCNFKSSQSYRFPIIDAVKSGCAENVQLLLNQEINLSVKDQEDIEAFDHATQRWRLAKIHADQFEQIFIEVSNAAVEGSPAYKHALDAHSLAQREMQTSINIMLILLRHGAAIGRRVDNDIRELMKLDKEGCYSADNVPCQIKQIGNDFVSEDDLPKPLLITQINPKIPVCYQSEYYELRPNPPINQFLLRCAEQLAQTYSKDIRELERYFLFKAEKVSLENLCLEQLARDRNAMNHLKTIQGESVELNEMGKKLSKLIDLSLSGAELQREHEICQNRIHEIIKLKTILGDDGSREFCNYCCGSIFPVILFTFGACSALGSIIVGASELPKALIANNGNNTFAESNIHCIDEVGNLMNNRTSPYNQYPSQRDRCLRSYKMTIGSGLVVLLWGCSLYSCFYSSKQNNGEEIID